MSQEELDDQLSLLYPDYLSLMLTYQRIEDYVFQFAYGYLSTRKTKPEDLKALRYKNLAELTRPFSWFAYAQGEKPEEAKPLLDRARNAAWRRNYYVHELFTDLASHGVDYEEAELKEGFGAIDSTLMLDREDAETIYAELLAKYGPHPKDHYRAGSISDLSLSRTDARLSQEDIGAPPAVRSAAVCSMYWELLETYSLFEGALYSAVSAIHERYPFLDKTNEEYLHHKSYGEYRKMLIFGVKNNNFVKMIVDDCLRNLTSFLKTLTALQTDRNYWIHFCLERKVTEPDDEPFLTSLDVITNLNKCRALASAALGEVLAFEVAVRQRLKA